jgi:hypothetical protein
LCLVGFGKTNRHMSRQNEEDKQQPVTVGHSVRMLAPREVQSCRKAFVVGRALVDALPATCWIRSTLLKQTEFRVDQEDCHG